MDTVLRLQYAIVAASVYPYYLRLNPNDDGKAAKYAHFAAVELIHEINKDLDEYVAEYHSEDKE